MFHTTVCWPCLLMESQKAILSFQQAWRVRKNTRHLNLLNEITRYMYYALIVIKKLKFIINLQKIHGDPWS